MREFRDARVIVFSGRGTTVQSCIVAFHRQIADELWIETMWGLPRSSLVGRPPFEAESEVSVHNGQLVVRPIPFRDVVAVATRDRDDLEDLQLQLASLGDFELDR